MHIAVKNAHVSGVERISAWSDLLDEINVFPIADGDTGRNLMVSLTPLRRLNADLDKTIHQLFLSARGNSGNIAAQFFAGFLKGDSTGNLAPGARAGRDLAWQAIEGPVPGTMLTVFDALAGSLEQEPFRNTPDQAAGIIDQLQAAVHSTTDVLPKLKQAGVVDSGALGMFLYLEGFFMSLIGRVDRFLSPFDAFRGKLEISSTFTEQAEEGYCIDMVVRLKDDHETAVRELSRFGHGIVQSSRKEFIKVHLHAASREEARRNLENLGDIVAWTDDDLGKQIREFKSKSAKKAVHIMTDAAGSVTYEDAQRLNMTLLDSYIVAGEKSLPETYFEPAELYETMRAGTKVSTSQASNFERHESYERVLNQYDRVLYLCVGSVFTGNYDVASKWKADHDPEGRLTVIDTGAASGRLGVIALATSRFASISDDPDAVIAFARRAVIKCEEYVFLDQLHYLAAGGRLSKFSAVFGDMLKMKPVISPTFEGAKKVGVVRNHLEQLKFAFDKLEADFDENSAPFIMLEFTDNRKWVAEELKPEVCRRFPKAEVMVQPLSLTSGVHMGPGTWAVAFLAAEV